MAEEIPEHIPEPVNYFNPLNPHAALTRNPEPPKKLSDQKISSPIKDLFELSEKYLKEWQRRSSVWSMT
jgi:hypothetical protein